MAANQYQSEICSFVEIKTINNEFCEFLASTREIIVFFNMDTQNVRSSRGWWKLFFE